MKKISVIIVFCNEQAAIRKSLKSVIKQNIDLNQLEIILVNDGSDDKSVNHIQDLLRHNIILINHKSRQGISRSRNQALKIAKGNYIMFMDAHIYLPPDALSILLNKFQEYTQVSGVCANYTSLINNDCNIIRDLRRQINFKKHNKDRLITLNDFTTFSIATGMYKKEIFSDVKFPEKYFDNSAGEDTCFQLFCHDAAHVFLYTPDLQVYHDARLDIKELKNKMIKEIYGFINIINYVINCNNPIKIPFLKHFIDYPLFTFLTFLIFLITGHIYYFILFMILFIIRYKDSFKVFNYTTDYKLRYFSYIIIKDFLQFLIVTYFLVLQCKNKFNLYESLKLILNIKKQQLMNYTQ